MALRTLKSDYIFITVSKTPWFQNLMQSNSSEAFHLISTVGFSWGQFLICDYFVLNMTKSQPILDVITVNRKKLLDIGQEGGCGHNAKKNKKYSRNCVLR